MSDPAKLSDFCFLPPENQRKLESLVNEMYSAQSDFEVRESEGKAALWALEVHNNQLAFPRHDQMKSDEQYRQAMKSAATSFLRNLDKMLLQKWENCNLICDYLLDSMEWQHPVNDLVVSAFMDRPPEGTELYKLGHKKPPQTRSELDLLHFKLADFSVAPLEQCYKRAVKTFAETSPELYRMKRDHAAFAARLDAMSATDIYDETNQFIDHADMLLAKMGHVEGALSQGRTMVPDLKQASALLKPEIGIERT